MKRDKKLEKIIEMSKEILKIQFDKISDREIDEFYIQTKFMLKKLKELKDDKE